jgi:hypothetical protein
VPGPSMPCRRFHGAAGTEQTLNTPPRVARTPAPICCSSRARRASPSSPSARTRPSPTSTRGLAYTNNLRSYPLAERDSLLCQRRCAVALAKRLASHTGQSLVDTTVLTIGACVGTKGAAVDTTPRAKALGLVAYGKHVGQTRELTAQAKQS